MAAGDGAAAFGTVDRVVQGGHDPRRFAADLLDRLRDLIILGAVPGAGQTGLLDAPADRLEKMSDQAGRFGQAELARAAEILSDGLIQMRGTTSPRLLLELMCAQVLLPGASTGEKAFAARLERLERRLDGLGSVGASPGSASRGARSAPGAPSRPRGAPGPPGGHPVRPGGHPVRLGRAPVRYGGGRGGAPPRSACRRHSPRGRSRPGGRARTGDHRGPEGIRSPGGCRSPAGTWSAGGCRSPDDRRRPGGTGLGCRRGDRPGEGSPGEGSRGQDAPAREAPARESAGQSAGAKVPGAGMPGRGRQRPGRLRHARPCRLGPGSSTPTRCASAGRMCSKR